MNKSTIEKMLEWLDGRLECAFSHTIYMVIDQGDYEMLGAIHSYILKHEKWRKKISGGPTLSRDRVNDLLDEIRDFGEEK